MMKRHPVGCSMLLILTGVLMIGVILVVPPTAGNRLVLAVGGGSLILLGIVRLVLAVGSALWGKVRSASSPPTDPILTFLDSVGIGQFASESYDESKAEMINFTSKKMTISRPEVRERIDRLEQQGKLRYLPNGQWVISVSGQLPDKYKPPELDWEREAYGEIFSGDFFGGE